jgi:AcrR family transcriptional regulator
MVELPAHLSGIPTGTAVMPRSELAIHQRERVIRKVASVFAKRGYQATTVDDLLAAGKVGVGNFYSLFEGKEDCFLACFDRAAGSIAVELEAATATSPDWDSRAYLGLKAVLDRLCADPLEARIVLVEAQCAGPVAMARYDAILDRAIAWLSIGREAHAGSEALPPNFERAAISGLAFYLQQRLLDARRLSPADLLAETAGFLLEPMIGSGQLERVARETRELITR